MFAALILISCASEDAADTALEQAPLPEIWGLVPAEDMDPDPDVVEYHLHASATEISWLEDSPTEVWAYNGRVPGPLLQARVGQTVRVIFTNDLDEATTIHWHGLRIDSAMDGTPMVQDPIEPGETFRYEFVPPEPASYWFHPHMRSHIQVERGLHGSLVVHEAEDLPVDRDRVFVVDDIRLDEDGSISRFALSMPDGRHGRFGNMLLLNGVSELIEDTIQPGAVERWRVVNVANARTMWIKVQGASWRVIGTDGGLIPQSYTASRVRLPVGARYDLEVIPDPGEESVSLEILLPAENGYDHYPMFEATISGEDLGGSPLDWSAPELPVVEISEQEVVLELDLEAGGLRDSWTINGESYDDAEDLLVEGGLPSEVVIRNKSLFEHPFHLHGQFFQITTRNDEPADEPGLKDTVLVEGEEEVRLYTDFGNPGRWMAHCHILEHAELGMMVDMVVSEPAP